MKGNDYFHRHKKCWMNFSGKRVNWFPAKNIHFFLLFTEVVKPRSTVFQKGILLHLINFLAFKEPI